MVQIENLLNMVQSSVGQGSLGAPLRNKPSLRLPLQVNPGLAASLTCSTSPTLLLPLLLGIFPS